MVPCNLTGGHIEENLSLVKEVGGCSCGNGGFEKGAALVKVDCS